VTPASGTAPADTGELEVMRNVLSLYDAIRRLPVLSRRDAAA
jgi:hypothetical protein